MELDHPCAQPKGLGIVLRILGVLVFAVVLGFIFGAVVMLLWNRLMPGLFGLKLINYWQGVGLVDPGAIARRLLWAQLQACVIPSLSAAPAASSRTLGQLQRLVASRRRAGL